MKETGISTLLLLWVWREQAAMLWYIVIYMFMVLSSVLPMEVFVFLTPGPSQAYHCTNEGTEGREVKGCLWNHTLGLWGTIQVGTAVWPHSDAQSAYTPSRETNPNLFIFLSDHRHRSSLNVSSPVRKHESQSWNSTCPKCLQDRMKCLIYWRLGQQTT